MKKRYEDLTRLGKIRRLRKVVFKVMEDYDIEVEEVKFLTIETNTMFVVRTKAGERFVLRIYSDEETTLNENQAEIFWLTSLLRDTDLRVPEPVARKDGDYISIVTVPDVPEDRRCVLFKWIPGNTLEENLSPENYYKLGQGLAELHQHARSLNPLPAQINPKKWDKVFYYPDEPVVYNTPEYNHLFTEDSIQIIDQAILKANKVFADLFSDLDGLILIHGDLHFWNVHCHREELYLIDFEDLNLGYPVQDISVTLSYGRHRDDYQELKKSFIKGYTSILEWPEVEERVIPTLMIARKIMFINYAARVINEPGEYIKSRIDEVRKFLTGEEIW